MKTVKHVEGVPWYRHVVRYTTAAGKRVKFVFWSPGDPWVRMEVSRTLAGSPGIREIKPGSVTITRSCP